MWRTFLWDLPNIGYVFTLVDRFYSTRSRDTLQLTLTVRLPLLPSSKKLIFPPAWAGKVALATEILLLSVIFLVSVSKTGLLEYALRTL